jgi:hypothetical protein
MIAQTAAIAENRDGYSKDASSYAHLDDDQLLDAAQQIGDAIERMMA